jgi:hypothetical protein
MPPRSQPKQLVTMKNHQVLYNKHPNQNAKGIAAWMQPILLLLMKKFVVFILFSLLLIISAYFLFNELFSNKRIFVLMPSLLGTIGCIYATHRIFKKYILHSKQP